jgi:hypothetical protein
MRDLRREYDPDLKVSPFEEHIFEIDGRNTRAYLGKHSGVPLLSALDILTVANDRNDMNEVSKTEWLEIKDRLYRERDDEMEFKLKWHKNIGDHEDFMPIKSAIYMLTTINEQEYTNTNERIKKIIAALEILKLAVDTVDYDLRVFRFTHHMLQKNGEHRESVSSGTTYWPEGMVHNFITGPPEKVLECTCLLFLCLI